MEEVCLGHGFACGTAGAQQAEANVAEAPPGVPHMVRSTTAAPIRPPRVGERGDVIGESISNTSKERSPHEIGDH